MNKPLLRGFLLACLFMPLSIYAQFSGNYAPSKWTITKTDEAKNSGSVDFSGAPSTMIIRGSDDPSGNSTDSVLIDVEVVVPLSGTLSFNWAYHTNDEDADPKYDLTFVLINGTPSPLSVATGDVDQSGTFSTLVAAGDVIGFRINAVDNIYGDAILTITDFVAPGSDGVLPVVFSHFDAQKRSSSVQLNWGTSSEVENDRFEIERSTNGRDFSTIGTVKGKGSTALTNNYNFIDYAPVAGINYYRLCQVDIDGQRHYTKIVSVNMNSATTVYPNPISTGLLNLVLDEPGVRRVSLYSASGNLIETKTVTGAKTPIYLKWDVSALRAGVYFFQTDAGTKPIRFVKH